MKVVPQRLRDLQLLVGPVGSERGQEAGAVAVNAEHDVGCMNCPPDCSVRPTVPALKVTGSRNRWHNRRHHLRSMHPRTPWNDFVADAERSVD